MKRNTLYNILILAGFTVALVGFVLKNETNYNYKSRVELGRSATLGGRTFLDDLDGDKQVDSIVESWPRIEFYDLNKEELVRRTGYSMEGAVPLTPETLYLANQYFNGRRETEGKLKEKLRELKE